MAQPAPVYLLLGPEEGEKREFIQSIQEKHAQTIPEAPELYRFYTGQTPIGDIVSLLQNGSLFSSYKFVTLFQIESLKKTEQQQLADYLSHPDPSATLFLVTSDYKVPPELNKSIPKSQRKTFFELFENKKREWLLSYFRKADISIDPDGIEMVLELVENNTLEMKIAADKLILFFRPGSVLSSDDIEEFIYHSKEENVFSLFQKLIHLDLAGSLEILHKILLSGESNGVQILGGLLWQFRRLLKLSRLLDRNFPAEEAFRSIPIRGKRNQRNYIDASRNFSTAQIEQLIATLAEYDTKVREQRGEVQRLLLEQYLYSVSKIGGKFSTNYSM